MINNIVYAIVVLIILFSLYHFVKDMYIIVYDWLYSENIFTTSYAKLKQIQYNLL